ncbi:MAG: di-heme oxidoredictase family protein, partial [Bacteroidota bacterium]
MLKYFFLSILVAIVLVYGCSTDDEGSSNYEPGEEFGGGQATVLDLSVNAFGNAAPNLTADKDLTFVSGNALFKRNWVTAPSSTVDLDGLGPVFNARSCSSCHDKDGRGRPPIAGEDETVGLLFRLSIPGVGPTG